MMVEVFTPTNENEAEVATAPPKSKSWLQWPSLSVQILVAFVLGGIVGLVFPTFGQQLKPMATLFLHMIQMLIAPLIFSTLVVGIAGCGDGKRVGRLGVKTLFYFTVMTLLALVIGLVIANIMQPGAGISLSSMAPSGAASAEIAQLQENSKAVAGGGFWGTVLHMVPASVVKAMAEGEILQIVVFSVFFALAVLAAGERGRPVVNLLSSVSDIMFRFVGFVMFFAPMGVFGAIAAAMGSNGLDVLGVFAKLVGSLYLALAVFIVLVLGTVCVLARIPVLRLIQSLREPIVLAFSTASSETALPKAMAALERLGVPKDVVGFVLPTGYSFNLDGSALYMAFAMLFVAQLAGIQLSFEQQIVIMLTLLLTSKGVAAVPRASLVILAGSLAAFNLPLEGLAIILGVDHFMDMGRTTVNLVGNCVATLVIGRWEGVLDDQKLYGLTDEEMAARQKAPKLRSKAMPA